MNAQTAQDGEQDTATQNHYETLGIEPTATPEQIRLAYRRAIRICHPDHNHGDPRAARLFREITGAYKILRDPDKRMAFDASIGLGQRYRPWYSPDADGDSSAQPLDPALRPWVRMAREIAGEGASSSDIADQLIDSGCSYESAWEIAWRARHDQMARRMKDSNAVGGTPFSSADGPWHPHKRTLWEKVRSGVARVFG